MLRATQKNANNMHSKILLQKKVGAIDNMECLCAMSVRVITLCCIMFIHPIHDGHVAH